VNYAVRFHFEDENADALRTSMERHHPTWFRLNREPGTEWPYWVDARNPTKAKFRIHVLIERAQDDVGVKNAKIRYETQPPLPAGLPTPHVGKFVRFAIPDPDDRHAVFTQLQRMGYDPVEFADEGATVGGVGFDNYRADIPTYHWSSILVEAYEAAGVDRFGADLGSRRLGFS